MNKDNETNNEFDFVHMMIVHYLSLCLMVRSTSFMNLFSSGPQGSNSVCNSIYRQMFQWPVWGNVDRRKTNLYISLY